MESLFEKCGVSGISSRISNSIASKFYRWGVFIASHSWMTIFSSLLLVGLCSCGFFRFQIETNPLELWVPKGFEFLKTTKWIINHIDYGIRPQSALIVAPNVLEPEVLRKLLKIHWKAIDSNGVLPNGTKIGWNDVCLKVPFITGASELTRNRRSLRDVSFDGNEFDELFEEAENLQGKQMREFNPSVDLKPSVYCNFVNNLPRGCYEKSILELWKYDIDKVNALTLEDVLETLKNVTISPVTGHDTNFTELLGNIERDENGRIISAKAVHTTWFLYLNFTEVKNKKIGNLAGTETWITEETSAFEDAYLENMESLNDVLNDNETNFYYSASKSFGDISYTTMFQETNKLGLGISLMFIYIQLVLSKFSWTEMRIALGSIGLLSIVFSFACTCGICAMIGIPYGPVHTSLPFLLMGLGVDDLFVLMACWRKVDDKTISIEERIGLMLKHAGASITVTSFTDIIAFLVGSLTVIPSLQSFCLYAAIGVFMTYIFAITFFVAIFTIDEYRIQANRNAFLPCLAHKHNAKLCCNLNLMHKFLEKLYSKFILTKSGKIIIVLSVICLSSISAVNIFKLEQKFDPTWFIPERTYLHKYIANLRTYFPESGSQGSIFMGKLNYTESLPEIAHLVTKMEENDQHFYNVDSWVKPFFEFVKKFYYKDLYKEMLTDYEWRYYLSKFLFNPNGGLYQAHFRFDHPLICGEPTGNVTVSWINFRFKKFENRDAHIPAMRELEKIIKDGNFTSGDGFVAPWATAYANWITDEIIDKELLRNICLAMACVMICTIFIIAEIQVCFWIFICVLLTLVNVCGFMQLWGLTIDLVSCIGLQLAIGLCVDYAAHIGHNFLLMKNGDRNKRVLDTILHIGAAVFYGGGSTLLALLLLSGSEAYTFQSFFKIFFLVIFFGLFHGVILLPVILSVLGPRPYKLSDKSDLQNDREMQPMQTNGNFLVASEKHNHDFDVY